MRKFIIVIVFVFLIAILISFNYLLWDREKQLENYEDLSNAKNLSIDTLGEKINNLDKQNRELTDKLSSLERESQNLKAKNAELIGENQQIMQELISKNELIVLLKTSINTAPMESVIKKWVDSVNLKNYKTAITYISENNQDEVFQNEEKIKTAYQSELKAIRLKSSKLYTELTDKEHLAKIQFEVVFEVDKPEAPSENSADIPQIIFKSGENEKYITMDLDQQTGEWRISEISNTP